VTTLAGVFVTSGVNEAGAGFLTVAAHGTDGTIMVGQLAPAEVRAMALAWLESAEAAEQDAAVLRVIRHLDLPDGFAGAVITELRNSRTE
jgi:hypothetical protein